MVNFGSHHLGWDTSAGVFKMFYILIRMMVIMMVYVFKYHLVLLRSVHFLYLL